MMVSMGVIDLDSRYDELEKKLKKDIDKTFGKCYKLIGRAKWRKKISSGRRLSDTFGKWNR